MRDTLKFRLSMLITLTILLVGVMLAGFVLVDYWQGHSLAEAVHQVLWKVVGVVVAACLLGIMLAGRIAGWVSRPIDKLMAGAKEIASGNLDHRVDVQSPRELGVLAASFNQMAGSLKEKVEGLDKARDEAEDLTHKLSAAYDESKEAAEKLQRANEWVTDMAFRLEETNQLLKSEKVQTDTIVHSIRDGIVALDRNERIMLVNPEAEEIFEIREEDFKGVPVQALVERLIDKAEDPEDLKKNLMAAVSDPETENVFTVTLARPYRRVLRRLSSAIRDDRGKITGRVVTFRDITREKEVDEMKTNFVSTVSHELRTPLTSIKGAINLLLGGQIDDPETAKEFMRIAEQNTDRLISLITTLLDLSRIEEGRVKMKFVKVDINALARSVIRSTSVLAKQNGVHVDASGLMKPLTVLCDKDNIEQVVTNLVGNAIKFSDAGGRVRVKTSVHEDDVHLAVEDEGPGIPKDKLDKVFDRFYQVDMSATRRKGGTGLGLAICRAIVKEHGGRIWAESPTMQGGRGARFAVSLPKPAVAGAPHDSLKPALAATSRLRVGKDDSLVLLVYPDPGTLKVHRNTFERAGFKVISASTGGEALKAARENVPGFILMDPLLPDLDGFDFAGILKGDNATSGVHVIFTNSLDEEGRRRCADIGCGYVANSFQEGELVSVVKGYLKQGV